VPRLSHLDREGRARMVDISAKAVTAREARAEGRVRMSTEAFEAAARGDLPKGDLLGVVRLAGITGAKRTTDLVPFCHPLHLTDVEVSARLDPGLPGVAIAARVKCVDRTGAEMEALTACSVAALTVIDMVKAVDPWATIEEVRVVAKRGGKSGVRRRPGRVSAA